MKVAGLLVYLVAVVSAENLLELAKQIGANSLVKLITDAGLAGTLAAGGPFTLLAPMDDAISMLPRAVLERLISDKEFDATMVKYHMMSGNVYLSQLTNEMLLPSLYIDKGKAVDIRFNTYGSIKTADGCHVTNYLPYQNASNGVIHVVNSVMYPFPVRNISAQLDIERDRFSTLLSAIQKANLASTLAAGPFTLFAPTNAAFSKIPYPTLNKLMANITALTDVLTYHVLNGSQWKAGLRQHDRETVHTLEGKLLTISVNYITERITVNNARIEEADMAVTNGVIHVIDTVLLPPAFVISGTI